MRSTLLFLHRWLGLAAWLVVSFLGLSGASLVFRPELDARLNPTLLRVKPGATQASWQEMYNAVEQRFPTAAISFLFAARQPDEAHEFWLDSGQTRVYVHPYTARILGTRTENGGLFPWLYAAHTKLFLGERGEQVAGWSGVVLASLSLSGLVLWWPRHRDLKAWKRAFLPHLKTNWKGRIYELHRAGGFWVSGLLLISSLTGASLVWGDLSKAAAGWLGTPPPAQLPATRPLASVSRGQAPSLDELVAQAQLAFPDGRLTRLAFPQKDGAPLIVRKKLPDELHPNGMNNIGVDPATGAILSVSDSRRATAGERLLNLRYPLHIGLAGGVVTRGLALFVGLSPSLLGVSGFLMWRARLRRQRLRKPSPSATTMALIAFLGAMSFAVPRSRGHSELDDTRFSVTGACRLGQDTRHLLPEFVLVRRELC